MDPMGRTETEMGLMQQQDPSDKRPKLERAQSAAEKENLPLQRTGSCLRRQYSQQEQPTTSRRMSSSEMGSGIPGGGGDPLVSGGGGGQRRHPYGHPANYHGHSNQAPTMHQTAAGQQAQHHQYGFQQYQAHPPGGPASRNQSRSYPDDDPSFYQVSGKRQYLGQKR